jgi:aminotransferase EvaB
LTSKIDKVPINDLSRGIARDQSELELAFSRVLGTGYVVMGPEHSAFEAELADYLGSGWALGVASGTDALELAIKAVMPAGKNAVLTAANAGGYTSTAARRAGFQLVFADVDAESLCVGLPQVISALSDDVGVVVVTHLYGNFTGITDLVAYCHDRGIAVVEDCAQAIGARRPEGAAGTIADVGTISFYPTKNLGAIGDGGAVVTSDETIAAKVKQLRQYGWKSKYDIAEAGGVNSRLDEVQAAFLRIRLPLLDDFNDRRRSIVAKYADAAAGGPLKVLPATGDSHVGHLAVCLVADRSAAQSYFASVGVQTDVHFPIPDYRQSGLRTPAITLENTEYAAGHVLSLPCFPELTDDEVEFVCSAIRGLPASL